MPDGRVAIMISDVAGKGLGAALLTTMLQGALSGMTLGVEPVKVLDHLNRFLCERDAVGRYATMFFGLLDADGTLEFVPASQPSPLLLRQGQVSELYSGGSFPVGLLEEASFQASRIQLEPGDTLLLYTDGVTEAEDRGQNQFGVERLKEVLSQNPDSTLEAIQTQILSAVGRFAEGAGQSDDITLLVVRYRRPGENAANTSGSKTVPQEVV
jgi:sigma-B regulation protein RsbU (phosphoserine phosphatase)